MCRNRFEGNDRGFKGFIGRQRDQHPTDSRRK
jgi:hypothetical protein